MRESKNELNHLKRKISFSFLGFSRMAHIAGVSVSATNPEMMTEVAIVIANCLYSSPVSPPRKAIGKKTEERTRTIAITGPVTSSMAMNEASLGE